MAMPDLEKLAARYGELAKLADRASCAVLVFSMLAALWPLAAALFLLAL